MNPAPQEPPFIFPYDFFHFWAAGNVAGAGGNPYDNASVYAQMLNVGWPLTEDFHGFLHPPWTMWLFVPLGSLSFGTAVVVWVLLSLLIAIMSFRLSKEWLFRRGLKLSATSATALTFICFTFPPLVSTIALGQTNILILLGLLLFARSLDRRKDFMGGAALSLLFIKPQLFMAFFCALLVFLVRNKRIRVVTGLLFGFIAQVVISLLLAPTVSLYFLDAAQHMAARSVVLTGASLGQILHLFIPKLWIFPLVTACAIAAVFWLSLREKGDWLWHLFFISMPISLLSAPYIWSHSFLPLLLPYLGLMHHAAQAHETRTVRAHSAFCIFGFFELVRPVQLVSFMALLPAAVLAISLRKNLSLAPRTPLHERS